VSCEVDICICVLIPGHLRLDVDLQLEPLFAGAPGDRALWSNGCTPTEPVACSIMYCSQVLEHGCCTPQVHLHINKYVHSALHLAAAEYLRLTPMEAAAVPPSA
jgi:hypothetical protein